MLPPTRKTGGSLKYTETFEDVALNNLHSDKSRAFDFEVAWAVLKGGHRDYLVLSQIMGLSVDTVADSARGALEYIRGYAKQRLERTANERDRLVELRVSASMASAHLAAVERQGLRNERKLAHGHLRRARSHAAEGSFTAAEWLQLVEAFEGRCGYCGVKPDKMHREHRIPLVRGGTNYITNIIPACASCNLRKHTMTEAEFREIGVRRIA